MAETSTEDIGFKAEARRVDERERRLLDIDDWDDRADATDADGEEERGVEACELEVLVEYDAMGTIAYDCR